jgi:hypothetical protein
MRDPALDFLSFILFIGACWIVCRYYWLRVLACGVGLATWGLAAVAVPVFFSWRYALDGHPVLAVVALAVSAIPAGFWGVAACAAASWVKAQQRRGMLWQPWNAT